MRGRRWHGFQVSVREGLNSALLRSRHDAMMSFRTRVVPWSYLRRKSHRDGLAVRCELGRPLQSGLVFGDSRRRADPRTPGCVRAHAKTGYTTVVRAIVSTHVTNTHLMTSASIIRVAKPRIEQSASQTPNLDETLTTFSHVLIDSYRLWLDINLRGMRAARSHYGCPPW